MVREAQVSVDNLVLPLIVKDGNGSKDPVGSMPDLFRLSIEDLKRECEEILDLGISVSPYFLLWNLRRKMLKVLRRYILMS